jgi:hypothetical protein
MTAPTPNALPDPGTTSPSGEDFDVLRHNIEAHVTAIREKHPEQKVLSVLDGQAVFRLASQGVLKQLQAEGVKGADTLSEKLETAAASDGYTDLFAVANRYRHAETVREAGVDAQADQHRLGLLANAAGGTAAAIVTSVLTPEGVAPVISRGRAMVVEYTDDQKSNAANLMNGLLEQAGDARPEEPLAA